MAQSTITGVQEMAEQTMNPLLTLMVGSPGSGKSTMAQEYLNTHNNRPDLIRVWHCFIGLLTKRKISLWTKEF